MARTYIYPQDKQLLTYQNIGKSRNANSWISNGSALLPVWSDWSTAYLAERIAMFKLRPRNDGWAYNSPTFHCVASGRSYADDDMGRYTGFSLMYGAHSHEVESMDWAVFPFSLIPQGTIPDPRNLTVEIGGFQANYSANPSVYNRLAGKNRSKFAETDIDIGMIVGESRQAIKTITDVILDLESLVKFIARGDVVGAVKLALGNSKTHEAEYRKSRVVRGKSVRKRATGRREKTYYDQNGKAIKESELRAMHPASRWLQFQFGLAPTVSDIQDAMDLHFGNTKPPRVAARSKVILETGDFKWTYRMVTETEIKDIHTRYLHSLGIHGTQVYALAYNLIPLSWLLDYFIDLGGFLSHVSALTGLRHLYSTYSVKIEAKGLHHYEGSQSSGGSYNASCKADFTFYERNVLDSMPFPTFPRLMKVSESSKQLNNLMAFITTAFSGHWNTRLNRQGS